MMSNHAVVCLFSTDNLKIHTDYISHISHVINLTLTISHVINLTLTISHVINLTLTISHIINYTLTISHVINHTLTISHVINHTLCHQLHTDYLTHHQLHIDYLTRPLHIQWKVSSITYCKIDIGLNRTLLDISLTLVLLGAE